MKEGVATGIPLSGRHLRVGWIKSEAVSFVDFQKRQGPNALVRLQKKIRLIFARIGDMVLYRTQPSDTEECVFPRPFPPLFQFVFRSF